MIKDVKLLITSNNMLLEKQILQWIEQGYSLKGPVTMGHDHYFCATMVKENKTDE